MNRRAPGSSVNLMISMLLIFRNKGKNSINCIPSKSRNPQNVSTSGKWKNTWSNKKSTFFIILSYVEAHKVQQRILELEKS
jgi:hypothetical protein